ncbi:MAG: hypothetical protein FWD84_01195 [Oscillospiraceae bacterium]|nr:hypothetical protein [Oscillospiraceae bacterium]
MQEIRTWLIRKKQWLKAAVGRAIRRIAQSAACAIYLSLDLTGEIHLCAVFSLALLTGLACLLTSIAQYPQTEVSAG